MLTGALATPMSCLLGWIPAVYPAQLAKPLTMVPFDLSSGKTPGAIFALKRNLLRPIVFSSLDLPPLLLLTLAPLTSTALKTVESPRGKKPWIGSDNLGIACTGAGDSDRLVGYRALLPLPVSGIVGGKWSDGPAILSVVE